MATSDHWDWYKDRAAALKQDWGQVVNYLEAEIRVPRIASDIDKREALVPTTTSKTELCYLDAKRVQVAIEDNAGTFEKPPKKKKCHSTLLLVLCLIFTAAIAITISILVLLHILH